MTRNRNKTKRSRIGTAVVELAVCLPVLVLLVTGSIELSNFIFLKQTLSSAAYEAGREAIRRDSTATSVREKADELLDARKVKDVTITMNPSPKNAKRGERVVVTLSAPSSANRVIVPRFVAGLNVDAVVTMVKE